MEQKTNTVSETSRKAFNQAFYLINNQKMKKDETDYLFHFQNDADYHIKMGFDFLASSPSSYRKAISLLTQVITENPDLKQAYLYRGIAKQRLQQASCSKDYHIALELDPKYPFPYYYLGIDRAENKDFEEAIVFFTKTIKYAPSFARAYHNRGVYFKIMKKYKKSLKDFSKAIEINPFLYLSYQLSIEVHEEMGDYIGAIALSSQLIEKQPTCADYYFQRSQLYRQINEKKQCVDDYQKASNMNPRKYRPLSLYIDQEGTTYDKAYLVGMVPEVYDILKENYPGYQLISQNLKIKDGFKFDVMHIRKKDGSEVDVYFCYADEVDF